MITDAIRVFLQQRIDIEKRDVGMVVCLLDEHGSRMVCHGKMDHGDSPEVNGDTLFEIGSITKTFTAVLLQDMVERGEMKLEDPVAKYLPGSFRMPTRFGRDITLLQLATHTSGLPRDPDNLDPKHADNPEADYTVEKLNAFLSGCKLTRTPGTRWEYSNLGIGLLGYVIALKAGTDYESLVVERICRPLKMESTRITLPPELKARFATGHNYLGYAVSSMEFNHQAGCGGLRSSAHDMLKYVSANLGLTETSLTPLLKKTHAVRFRSALRAGSTALVWEVVVDPSGRKIISHGGGTFGFRAYAGFDPARRRGVVILSNSSATGVFDPGSIGLLLLQSEWQPDRRPKTRKISRQAYDSYVGQYRLEPDLKLGMLLLRLMFLNAPKAIFWVPAVFGLAALLLLFWLTASWIAVGCAAVAAGCLAALGVPAMSRVVCTLLRPTLGIRREGDRLLGQATRRSRFILRLMPNIYGLFVRPVPIRFESWLPATSEILPESETRFFEAVSGIPMTFSRDRRGRVNRLTAHSFGTELSFQKISHQPLETPEPPEPRAILELDGKFYDACVGEYEFAPDAAFPTGITLTIRRSGNQLVGLARGRNGGGGEFEMYPESEMKFFLKMNGAQFNFIKNGAGEVTGVIHRVMGLPDSVGRKLNH